MKQLKPILIIAVCAILSVFGLIFQFSLGRKEKRTERETEAPEENSSEESVEINEEVEEERYGQTYGWSVYFSHMDAVMDDDEFLPYQAYADLVGATESFLMEQTEIVLEDGMDYELYLNPDMTYKKGNLISFHCYFANLDIEQEIEYVYDDNRMDYTTIQFTNKGEWGVTWIK